MQVVLLLVPAWTRLKEEEDVVAGGVEGEEEGRGSVSRWEIQRCYGGLVSGRLRKR